MSIVKVIFLVIVFGGILYMMLEEANYFFRHWMSKRAHSLKGVQKVKTPTEHQQVALVLSIVESGQGMYAIIPTPGDSPWTVRVVWVYEPVTGENAFELPRLVITPPIEPQ